MQIVDNCELISVYSSIVVILKEHIFPRSPNPYLFNKSVEWKSFGMTQNQKNLVSSLIAS